MMTHHLITIVYSFLLKVFRHPYRFIYVPGISILMSRNSFADMTTANLIIPVEHEEGMVIFGFLAVMTILCFGFIRLIKKFFRGFCWNCFSRKAMQDTGTVYLRGLLMILPYKRWQCRFCHHVKDIKQKDFSSETSDVKRSSVYSNTSSSLIGAIFGVGFDGAGVFGGDGGYGGDGGGGCGGGDGGGC